MAHIYALPMPPVPADATRQERLQMLEGYKAELVKFNPTYFNADGSKKSFGRWLVDLFS